jgi:hypothetical protein
MKRSILTIAAAIAMSIAANIIVATQVGFFAKIGPSDTQMHTIPAVSSDTFTLNAATQTLTNKTLTSPTLTSALTAPNGGTGFGTWAKGQLLVGATSTTTGQLTLGADTDCLVADSAQTLGIKWGSCSGGGSGVIQVIGVTVDGGGGVPSTGLQGFRSFPQSGTIVRVRVIADQTGSAVFGVWKDTFANFPPTIADSITASAPPTLSSAQASEDATLTGWTTSVSAGDVFAFNLSSASTVTRVTLEIWIQV